MASPTANRDVTVLSLCAGLGGLDLGLGLACEAAGLRARTLCYVEREAYCAAALVARMEEQALDQAPVWDDLRTFSGNGRWTGLVDVVLAGYPCQPFSVAGKQQGEDDPRHLWPEVRRVIGEAAPALVVLENVPGHVTRGLREVLTDLADLGYGVELRSGLPSFGLYSAAEVGGSHRRQRLFVVAYSLRDGFQGERCEWILDRFREAQRDNADRCGMRSPWHGRSNWRTLGDSSSEGLEVGPCIGFHAGSQQQAAERAGAGVADSSRDETRVQAQDTESGEGSRGGCARVADAERGDLREQQGWSSRTDWSCPPELGGSVPFPPYRNDGAGWHGYLQLFPQCAPAFEVESPLEPTVRRGSDGLPAWMERCDPRRYRTDRLRALGNAVMPQQAAHAIFDLFGRT